MKAKFLNTGFNSASFNFACDEVLLDYVSKTGIPVLRFYGFDPTSCTIGYFQGMELEIDTQKANQAGVECVRRITGGGAVMHDQNQFTYTLIIPEKMLSKNILESYEQICYSIISGLKRLNLDAKFAPLNDIVLNNQKISGNAQTRKKGCVLQHGTLLLDVDVDLMFSLLKVPDEKIKHKLIQSVKKRVTGINQHLENPILFDEISKILKEEFLKNFNFSEFQDFDISDFNFDIQKLQSEKYASDDWNLKY